MKEKSINVFTSYYDKKGRPLVITCTTKHSNGIYTKGIAICSDTDIRNGTFTKARGNKIARGRSEKAFEEQQSCNQILRDNIVEVVEAGGLLDNPKYLYKQQYNILPGAHQLKIIQREEEYRREL